MKLYPWQNMQFASASLRDSASGDGLDILVITNEGTEEFSEKIT